MMGNILIENVLVFAIGVSVGIGFFFLKKKKYNSIINKLIKTIEDREEWITFIEQKHLQALDNCKNKA